MRLLKSNSQNRPVAAAAICAVLSLATTSSAPAQQDPKRAGPGADQCAELRNVLIPNTRITGVQHGVSSQGTGYCEVAATVLPQHDVKVRLPDLWKRRYLQFGGGGLDGRVPDLSVPSSPVISTSKDPIDGGFVVAASNGGHRAETYPGAGFAVDRGLTLSYATAKIYDTDLVGRTLVKAYYGSDAEYNYFAGCSNGGKNASVAAANFADRYDGIIGGDGPWGQADDPVNGSDMTGLTMKWVRTIQLGVLSQAKGDALYKRTVAQCDKQDGLSDGVISNVQGCNFEQAARAMQCAPGADRADCLTPKELATISAHGSALTEGGKTIGVPWSRSGNFGRFGNIDALSGGFLQMAFRSAEPPDISAMNIHEAYPKVQDSLDGVYTMTGRMTGIERYLGKNKKLILFHGWDDMEVPPYTSINFYQALEKHVPAKTKQNARLYMVPGMPHCRGGDGADAANLLQVMAAWVEQGIEPGAAKNPVVAWERPNNNNTGPQGIETAKFSRPLCAFPQYASYTGGDSKAASSFTCRRPQSARR